MLRQRFVRHRYRIVDTDIPVSLVGLLAGLLLLGANAASQIDFSEQIADLEARNVRIKTHPRTGAVRLIGAGPQAPLMVPSVNEATPPGYRRKDSGY